MTQTSNTDSELERTFSVLQKYPSQSFSEKFLLSLKKRHRKTPKCLNELFGEGEDFLFFASEQRVLVGGSEIGIWRCFAFREALKNPRGEDTGRALSSMCRA